MNDVAYVAYQAYALEVQAVLTDYQFIEEGLRMYASRAYDLVRARVGTDMAFKYSCRDTEKDPLGKLISRFENLSSRDDMVKELRELVRHRNQIAHESFLLTSEQHNDPAYLDAQAERLRKLRKRTKPLAESLLKEAGRLDELVKTHNKPLQPERAKTRAPAEWRRWA